MVGNASAPRAVNSQSRRARGVAVAHSSVLLRRSRVLATTWGYVVVHSTPSHPWTVTWTVRLKRTWPWLSLPTRRSRPHSKPGSKDETPARSAVVSTDRVPCIYAAERLRSQETLSSDRLQGACADVRHSTHTGHSTDRPSRARVAESCWSFNGITSSTCRKHLGAWQAAAHAWRASAIGGLTSPGRAVRCAATCGGSARVRTRIHVVLGCIPVRVDAVGGIVT